MKKILLGILLGTFLIFIAGIYFVYKGASFLKNTITSSTSNITTSFDNKSASNMNGIAQIFLGVTSLISPLEFSENEKGIVLKIKAEKEDKTNFNFEVKERSLFVKGEVVKNSANSKSSRSISQTIPLNFDVDIEKMANEYKDGYFVVTIPRKY